MGTGEKHPATEHEGKDGLLNPQTIRTKDPESAAATRTKGCYQTLRSRKVPLLHVVYGAAAIIVITLIIVIVVLSQRGSYVRCKDGWIMYRDRCYYYSEKFDTWNNSQKFCKDHKSSLATIDNKEEYDFLNHMKNGENYWIGLSRTNNGWVWTNGTAYSESTELFKIERLPIPDGGLEHVFLNHKGVKSGSEKVLTKSFCRTELL